MRTPKGEISKRQKAKAIKLLAATVDDESAPIYLRVMSARSLLAQPKPPPPPAENESEFPSGAKVIILADGEQYEHTGDGPVIVLPSNGRERLAEERQRQRLEHLAELAIEDDEEPPILEPLPPPAEPVKIISRGKALLREIRARRRALRA